MLAHCLTTIVPRMPLASAIDTARIHPASALTGARTAVVTTRPCRARPQTISAVSLSGEGQVPMPGQVSLAHHGVLCLDEPPEYQRLGQEVWRQPLEEGLLYRQSRGRAEWA
jgi:magnesium chelatase family protein